MPNTDNEATNISGQLLMLDDKTPHVACVVQAVMPTSGKPEVVETTLTDSVGRYEFRNLKPGRYQIRCYTTDGYVYYQDAKVLRLRARATVSDINLRIPPFKRGR